ncbi:MAG: PepSY domain-containing protein, partial [Bacteroidota bacterium]
MAISLWRLSHLGLAAISGIFLLIASLTGAILSFEPVYEGAQGYYVDRAQHLTIADLTEKLRGHFPEMMSAGRDHNGYIHVTVFGDEGEEQFYVDPFSGQRLGAMIETPAVFEFSRTLHRSLFFGSAGRFLVGLASVILLFLSVTGSALVLKKQGGLSGYFKKVIKEEFYKDYHTKLGKVALLTVLVISATGAYLFLERFSVIPKEASEHIIDFDALKETPGISFTSFETFQSYRVEDLKALIFPFSEFVDDFYELKLQDRDLLINQVTGDVVSEIIHPTTQQLSDLSFMLHTAEGQPYWAVLLFFTSLSLLFFIFSGFKVYRERVSQKTTIVNPFVKEECDVIVAYGSETGRTVAFAEALHKGLLSAKRKSHLLSMNAFDDMHQLQQLIVV